MHIKTLTISGFKSYLSPEPLPPFSPAHNVVVGRNGSGKSNFFQAVRFVLADAYASLAREDRQALLHEGTGTSTTLSAFVEVVFSNADGRFPTGKDELVLRRTIGLKKDEFSIDRRSASRADVMNLLESAGFSRTNPYYIVPQGRITFLTNAKDRERLELLKDVAGTTVYDDKKAESLKTLEAAEIRRAKLLTTLASIDSRLADLEDDLAELRAFQAKERERKGLEYTLWEGELREITGVLGDMEAGRNDTLHVANERRKAFVARELRIAELEAHLTTLRNALDLLALESTSAAAEAHELVRALTALECALQDAEALAAGAVGRRGELAREVQELEERIADKRREVDAVVPEYRAALGEEQATRLALDGQTARVDALFAKQARGAQFADQPARDAFLRGQVDALKLAQAEADTRLAGADAALQEGARALDAVAEEATALDARARAAATDERAQGAELAAARESEARLGERRKELWREEGRVEVMRRQAEEELKGAQRHLATMMDRDTSSGLKALDRLVARLGLTGVHGPLYKLFTSPQEYALAVEETAGTALFHVVVDSDDVASRLVDAMNAERLGRLTFVPLNRVRVREQTYPDTQDVTPLIRRLTFDEKLRPAFEQVFGSTVVAADLHVATAYRRSHGLNVITLDGDRADRKGALTGGYHDVRRSRLEGVKSVQHWHAKFDEAADRAGAVAREVAQADQALTRAIGQAQVLDARRKASRSRRENLLAELGEAQAEADRLRAVLDRAERARDDARREGETLRVRVAALEDEMGRPLEQGLTDDEQLAARELAKEVEQLKAELAEQTAKRSELEARKDALEIELHESLLRKRDGLRAQLEGTSGGDGTAGGEGAAGATQPTEEEIEAKRREVAAVQKQVDELKEQTRANDEKKDELETEIQTTNDTLEKIRAEQLEDGRGIAKSQKVVERYISKRQTLLERKEECTKLIRDLGVLPEDAVEKYQDMDSTKLLKHLHKVKTALGKFSHVNKKALQMYEKYSAQRDDIHARFGEMEKSSESIQALIRSLDKKKDAAIENTFRDVAKHFEAIFEKLVPAGRGRLVMNKRAENADEEEEEEEDEERSTIDSYTGVSIKVSFNSKSDEGLRIQQLSGGQKALVALALVFSIQRCDPAPFYLFDEIDANLDAQYRTSVANMIHELSEDAQFITTTFRPEMIQTCDKAYGVFFSNEKVSSIRSISKENAMQFVDYTMQEAS